MLVAGWLLLNNQLVSPKPQQELAPEVTQQPSPDVIFREGVVNESTGSTQGSVKEFSVVGSPFKFNPSEIRVKKGDTVKITFKNSQGFHDFGIDEFNVKTKQANSPSEETVTFVADKAGEYPYYCSVGQHRANGMEGKLIVE